MSNRDLLAIRKDIDIIDEQVMELLNKRFAHMKAIGNLKKDQPIKDLEREQTILDKAEVFQYYQQIKSVYSTIFTESCSIQMMKGQYYLIGASLPYSFSDEIHHYLGNDNYTKWETADFQVALTEKPFQGLNITAPYKEEWRKMAGTASKIVQKTGVVNHITFNNNSYQFENTDYQGFINLLRYNKINVHGKKALIIGGGSTSKTVAHALENLGIGKCIKLVRNVREDDEHFIHSYAKFNDSEIIINTTTFGVYPNIQDSWLFPIDSFKHLQVVIDVNYSPFRSPLLVSAKQLGIETINGLYMLTEVAKLSEKIWSPALNFDSQKLYSHFALSKTSLCLIGMPFAGKTTIGSCLAGQMNRQFVDTDTILAAEQHDILQLGSSADGIKQFRQYETALLREQVGKNSLVIATGGGAIMSELNQNYLLATGLVVFIDTPLEVLLTRLDTLHPLSKTADELTALYQERITKYRDIADITVNGNQAIEKIVAEIEAKFNAYFNN